MPADPAAALLYADERRNHKLYGRASSSCVEREWERVVFMCLCVCLFIELCLCRRYHDAELHVMLIQV
jgi:hypothetical protein